mmetsp:Transcript_12509/g.41747  ORF Transcript_12509/g.41747 Transcript_12509/m.41747 type:complete len:213 (-) Transcript_12509:80-718(-)
MPSHDVSTTASPTSRPCRRSSTTLTRAGLVGRMEATRQEMPGSPSMSETAHAGPKSQNTEAKTPRASAQTRTQPCSRHASEHAASVASVATSQRTTTAWPSHRARHSPTSSDCSDPRCAPDSPAPISRTLTCRFSSDSLSADASARARPRSLSRTYGLAPRSRCATGVGSKSVTPLTPASTMFLTTSTPRPLRPQTRTVDAAILRWPSRPRT